MLAEGMAEKIIGMYVLGTNIRTIGGWMKIHSLGSSFRDRVYRVPLPI